MASWKTVCFRIWEYLKEASGERDYDHYLAWAKRAGLTPLSREDFFLSQIEARYPPQQVLLKIQAVGASFTAAAGISCLRPRSDA